MKPVHLIAMMLAAATATTLTGCSKSAGGKPDADDKAAPPVKADAKSDTKADAKPDAGVTLDAETQERIGLKLESPTPAQWQPGMRASGRVANPLTFMSAATDLETARTAAAASQAELARTRKLVEQENASPRALEAAQAATARDALALKAAETKFATDWGMVLAGQTNLVAYAEHLQADDLSLVKISLPVGAFPDPLPPTATIYLLGRETNAIAADLADNLLVDPTTQTQTLLYSVKQKLPPEVSFEAWLNLPGEPVSGVAVPVDAILRYQGQGWVYAQTGTNQFARAAVPLDRLLKTGWFVAEDLSATNRIVVGGAQAVLSAELSGGFSSGQRD